MTNGVKGKKNACSSAAPAAPAPAVSATENRPRTGTGVRAAGPAGGAAGCRGAIRSWGVSGLGTAVWYFISTCSSPCHLRAALGTLMPTLSSRRHPHTPDRL